MFRGYCWNYWMCLVILEFLREKLIFGKVWLKLKLKESMSGVDVDSVCNILQFIAMDQMFMFPSKHVGWNTHAQCESIGRWALEG